MGKDNIPFHTVIFPSSLIATGDKWTMLDRISTTEYLNYDGGKFSKSNSRGVFGSNCAETGIPADVWRYYLLSNRPKSLDADFSWKTFQLSNNSELLANLGNFCNRALAFTSKNFGGKVPDSKGGDAAAKAVAVEVDKVLADWVSLLQRQQIREVAKLIMAASRLGNGYFQETKPWELLKKGDAASIEAAAVVLGMCIQLVHVLAIMCYPIMPGVSHQLTQQIGMPPLIPSEKDIAPGTFKGVTMKWQWDAVPAGGTLPEPFTIFDKMMDEDVAEWAGKYGSNLEAAKEFPALLRVGKVLSVEDHPTADKLYVLRVSLGGSERQVVAGLKTSYAADALVGKIVILVCNLEVAKIKDVESQGMVLVADKKGLMGLLGVPDSVALGTPVLPAGYSGPGEGEISLKASKAIGIKSSNGSVVLGDAILFASETPVVAENVGLSVCPVR